MKVAVIGVGAMGGNHARAYRDIPGVDLVAVVDPDLTVAESVARVRGTRAYRSVAEMLDRERPDAASVAVPTQLHHDIAMQLLSSGCHVLVEKPIASTIAEADSLITAADRAGLVLMVGHIERYNPAVLELKRRFDAGDAGRVFQITARRLGPFPPRIRDVGVVVDLATHDLEVMRYLTGAEPVRVYAETRREVHTSHEDLFAGLVRFADQTVGVLEVNWLTPTKLRELSVTGERGMFRVDYLTQELFFFENARLDRAQWSKIDAFPGVSQGAMTRPFFAKDEPLRLELDAFVAAVQGDRSRVVDGRDGKAALRLALALLRSAETRQVVELESGQ